MTLRCTMNEQTISIKHDSDIEDLYPDFFFREGWNQGGKINRPG